MSITAEEAKLLFPDNIILEMREHSSIYQYTKFQAEYFDISDDIAIDHFKIRIKSKKIAIYHETVYPPWKCTRVIKFVLL